MYRKELFSCSFEKERCEPSRARRLTTSCACPPKFRVRGKCQISGGPNCYDLRVGVAEEKFRSAVASKSHIPDAVYAKVWGMHPRLKTALRCIGTRSPSLVPQLVPGLKLRGVSLSDAVVGSLVEFVCQDKWRWGAKRTAEQCAWFAVMLEYVLTYGFQRGFLIRSMSLGVLVRRFRDAFLHVLKHHGVDCPTLQAIRHLRSFGFGNQSGIAASREFVHGDEILAVCLRIAEHVPQLDLQRRGKLFARLFLLLTDDTDPLA